LSKLEIKETAGKGRGVFARVPFAKDDVIEVVPIILIVPEHWHYIEPTVLERYIFRFGPEGEHVAVALGYGSIYNHSFQPNAVYLKVWEEQIIRFVAIREISEGEEITINYNGSPDSQAPMDFEVTE
jgi:SET domain-containing protein